MSFWLISMQKSPIIGRFSYSAENKSRFLLSFYVQRRSHFFFRRLISIYKFFTDKSLISYFTGYLFILRQGCFHQFGFYLIKMEKHILVFWMDLQLASEIISTSTIPFTCSNSSSNFSVENLHANEQKMFSLNSTHEFLLGCS